MHFILLIFVPHTETQIQAGNVAEHFAPILKYCGWCLSHIAVFDRTHKSYLFFDETTLNHLKRGIRLTEKLAKKVRRQGKAFSRFDSITIQCEKYESHLLIPIEILGSAGVVTCYALFDTGASTTMLSKDTILETGHDDLLAAPRRSFNTVNGRMSCPIVRRNVNAAGLRREIEVAVNQTDELNLIGMNYFEGLKYIADFENSCIYVWEE
jgi:predicted aspartyl protease